jgi:hypothetical protein
MAQSFPNELLQEIFKNESQNIKFLHSCLLVSKSWSNNVIPVLWNRPFHLLLHYKKKYSHLIISTYLNKHATYNYHSFLRHLSFFSFLASVQEWCTLNLHENDPIALQKPKEIFLYFANFGTSLQSLDFVFEFDYLYKLNVSLELTNLMNANIFKVMIGVLSQDTKVSEWISNVKKILLNGNIIGRYDFSKILYACRNIKTVSNRFTLALVLSKF